MYKEKSFSDFQASVNDAWEMDEENFELSSSCDVRIPKNVSNYSDPNIIHNKLVKLSKDIPQIHKLDKKSINYNNKDDKNANISDKEVTHKQKIRHFPGRPQLQRYTSFASEEKCDLKIEKFQALLKSSELNISDLRKASWSGIPIKLRAVTWRLLLEYSPLNLERRQEIIESKRKNYWDLVKQYFNEEKDQKTYKQIHLDIQRMTLIQQEIVQEMFKRILFIWAIRHPASGYVQGINDLVTPFYIVFLQEVLPANINLENFQVSSLTEEQRNIIEADSFWCLSKFLNGIQDNYVFAQLGIQKKINQLKDLIQRIDLPLHLHLTNHGVDYLQFSFRWVINLLTRELPLHCTVRIWDTYLAEYDSFASFQVYVCAAFLMFWKDKLMKENEFQGLMLLLQNLPTQNWCNSDISLIVAEAYKLKFMFGDAPKHLEQYGT